jgi:fatty acid desaturase
MMTTASPSSGFRLTTRVDGSRQAFTTEYASLLETVKDQGLMRRRVGFYGSLFGGLTLALAAATGAFVALGDSWFQLIVAAVLGVILTQYAFLAHEASHRQVLTSGRANDGLGRAVGTFVVGMSYSWWMTKHTRHHANPNKLGKDPDVATGMIAFFEEAAVGRVGLRRWITSRQGTLFFPLLMLEGVNLHWQSMRHLVGRGKVHGRATELAGLGLRFALYLGVVFWYLPVGLAFAFVAVQLGVFGLYMGASFAPNHKGMPLVDKDASLDFFSRQVLTSRNISGGLRSSALLGGLNYQVEHHLFPSMARPHLARARHLVRERCFALGVPYTETTLMRSYGIVIRYLNRVGLAARDPFQCPVVASYRLR